MMGGVLLGCGSQVSIDGSQGGGDPGVGGEGPAVSTCGAGVTPSLAIGGRHFMLWDVQLPIATQLQFFVDIDGSATPEVTLSFTNADPPGQARGPFEVGFNRCDRMRCHGEA